jgi:hypothetical protein
MSAKFGIGTLATFKESLSRSAPPARLRPALQGLWWAAKGEWDRAHTLVQDEESTEAAWVHAYLHRVEGDLPNAGYWYRRAGRASASGSLDEEWQAIAADLLRA